MRVNAVWCVTLIATMPLRTQVRSRHRRGRAAAAAGTAGLAAAGTAAGASAGTRAGIGAASTAAVLGRGWSLRRSTPVEGLEGIGDTGGIELLVADALAAIPWLVHGFSTRTGGDSEIGEAHVLNLGFTDWDSRACVSQNRRKFLHALTAENMSLVALRQLHSDLMHVIGEPPESRPHEPKSHEPAGGACATLPSGRREVRSPVGTPVASPARTPVGTPVSAPAAPLQGDALITAQPGLLLAAQSADCVPILLADPVRRVAAAIHAGWRGTLARIAAKTVGRMRLECGTRPAMCWPRLARPLAGVATK